MIRNSQYFCEVRHVKIPGWLEIPNISVKIKLMATKPHSQYFCENNIDGNQSPPTRYSSSLELNECSTSVDRGDRMGADTGCDEWLRLTAEV